MMHCAGRYGLERNLRGWWRLKNANEGVQDLIGTNNAGFVGGMTYGTQGGRGCVVFDGVNGYVYIADNANLDKLTGDFSICAWIYVDSLATDFDIYGQRVDASNQGRFYVKTDGYIRGYDYLAGAFVNEVVASSQQISIGAWYHVAWVCDRDASNYVYVNGTAATLSTNTYATTSINYAADNICGGYPGSASYSQGKAFDLRQYGRVLSAAEIARLARIY